MKDLIIKLRTSLPTILTLISVDGYRRSVANDKATRKYEESCKALEITNQKLEELHKDALLKRENLELSKAKNAAIEGRISEKIEIFGAYSNKLSEIFKSEDANTKTNDLSRLYKQALENLESLNSDVEELNFNIEKQYSELKKVLDTFSENKTKFIDWNSIDVMLSELSTAQLGAISHIFLGIAIYYAVMSIASSYYSDQLIRYFKLETKYPKLAKWLKYRRMYQNFNIAFNLLLILALVGYMIYTNLAVFPDI